MLGVALALVFGISHLLGASPGRSGNPSARPAAASAGSPGARTPNAGADRPSRVNAANAAKKAKAGKVKIPLAVPNGPCADDDLRVSPSVDGAAYAGHDVTITLNLTAVESPACTWQVSPESVVVKLTSGSDRVWSTQDCPSAVDRRSVVVRRGHLTKVGVTWSGQRSDEECTRTTLWAQPGYYHAEAAALGAEPANQQFRLLTPIRPTITATPKVTAKPTSSAKPTEKKSR